MPTPQETFEAYISVWNTADEAERQLLLEKCWAEDGIYCDPSVLVSGRQALNELIGRDYIKFPGSRIELRSALEVHHNKIRFAWAFLNQEGKTLNEGIDFGELGQDNLLKSITGFFGPLPALP